MKLRFHNLLIFSGLVISLLFLLGGFEAGQVKNDTISSTVILSYFEDGGGYDRDLTEGKIEKGKIYSHMNKSHKILTGRDLAQFK